jgi:XTP/dITP diphosphohydrolase
VTEILLATRNRHKLKEVREIFEGTGFTVVSTDELDATLPEVEEDGDTFRANADKKARTLAQLTGRITIADDSGIEVDFLGGAPGVYSARFAGVDGHGADAANNRLLIQKLQGVPREERTARYRCAIALVTPAGEARYTDGTVEGYIVDEPLGDGGFGYDGHFGVTGDAAGRTMAQLSAGEKHAISHRGEALRKVLPLLRELIDGA